MLVICQRDDYEITGESFVIFPVTVFVVAQDNNSTIGYVWSYVGFLFDSEAAHRGNFSRCALGS